MNTTPRLLALALVAALAACNRAPSNEAATTPESKAQSDARGAARPGLDPGSTQARPGFPFAMKWTALT